MEESFFYRIWGLAILICGNGSPQFQSFLGSLKGSKFLAMARALDFVDRLRVSLVKGAWVLIAIIFANVSTHENNEKRQDLLSSDFKPTRAFQPMDSDL
tara:strand:- start:97 stop:393 length:297 start_codon:yes stop_codon:yes gene_type:complete